LRLRFLVPAHETVGCVVIIVVVILLIAMQNRLTDDDRRMAMAALPIAIRDRINPAKPES